MKFVYSSISFGSLQDQMLTFAFDNFSTVATAVSFSTAMEGPGLQLAAFKALMPSLCLVLSLFRCCRVRLSVTPWTVAPPGSCLWDSPGKRT